MINKKLYLPALGAILVGSTMFMVGNVSAEGFQNRQTEIAQKIAQKFNLNQSEVEKVFTDFHQEKQSQRQAQLTEKLNQAQKDGKITEAQKTAILTKLAEKTASRPDMGKDQTAEQRKASMEQQKTEMDNWLKVNGLTTETLKSIIGGGFQGMGKGHMMGGLPK